MLTKAKQSKKNREDADRLTKDYLQNVFYELFGNPVKNDKKFAETKVGEVCGCIVPGRDKPKSFTGKIQKNRLVESFSRPHATLEP